MLEHVEPFSRGGADSKRNLVVSCWQCDRDKGGKNLEEFRKRHGGGLFYGERPKPSVGQRPHRVIEIDTSFGWIDQLGQLRPRSWEEYCQMQKDKISQDKRAERNLEKERWKQATNPRMVRLGEALQKAGLN